MIKEPNRKTIKASEQNTYLRHKDWEFEIDVYETSGEVKVNNKVVYVGKGFVPHGGVILKNIYNQNYRMAYDIGITGIYIFPNKEGRNNNYKTKFLVLGPPDFIQVDNNYNHLKPSDEFNPFVQSKEVKMNFNTFPYSFTKSNFDKLGFNMNTYNEDIESEINVKYISKEEMFGDGSGYLIVEQKFIFTKYDSEPAHEPTGGLNAARIHPIVRIYFEKSKHEYVESFRADYRLYINLDTWNIQRKIKGKNGITVGTILDRKTTKGKTNNAAGLFKDDDENSGSVFNGGVANVIFGASEKPLVAEIITNGLIADKTKPVWDNIHWWGAGKDWVAGSTPGSFHAVHLHWRWGKSVQAQVPEFIAKYSPITPRNVGEEEFRGQGIGGELTDPKIRKQTLRIAVVKNDPSFYYENKMSSGYIYNYNDFKTKNEVFGNWFKEMNPIPKDISKGEDIVLYYSVEIKLTDCEGYTKRGILDGSLFVQGLFFAHETENPSLILSGSQNSFYKPDKPDNKLWERTPRKK